MAKQQSPSRRGSKANEDTLLVVTDLRMPDRDTRDLLRSSQTKALSTVVVGVERLAANMKNFSTQFGLALESMAASSGSFELDEVTVSVELTAEGEVALLGSGVTAGGKAGIELKFTRAR